MREVKVIDRAEPSVAPPPMIRHIVAKREDGEMEDKALCGFVWDRLHVSAGPMCEACVAEFKRREGL